MQALVNTISALSSSKLGSGDSSPNNSIIKVSNRTCGTSERENTTSESSGSASADGLLVVKRRHTAKQVHSQMVKKKQTKESAEHAYLAATRQIKNEKGSKITHIVSKISRLYNTALNQTTVRRRIRLGQENAPPRMGGGRKAVFSGPIEAALVDAISSYVGLACVEQ